MVKTQGSRARSSRPLKVRKYPLERDRAGTILPSSDWGVPLPLSWDKSEEPHHFTARFDSPTIADQEHGT
jgi:hypothetical protein